MADQITNYKCPACTGPLHFVGSSGQLECDYCGSKYSVAEIEKLYREKNENAAEAKAEAERKAEEEKDSWEYTQEQWTGEGMKAYNCPSCGAELIMEETTAATSCPYCGNPTVVPGQFSGALKPEYILPFRLDKKAAVSALEKHCLKKPLLPKAFTADNHLEEVKGVYVPFWLYDGTASAYGRYEAERSTSRRHGDDEIITTEHYLVERSGVINFEKIPADAATKMPDDLMDSIEPFEYGELKEFSMSYLPGFIADRYDVTAKDDAERAVSRAKGTAVSAMKSDIRGYSVIHTIQETASMKQGSVHYALMPVWLLNTKWNGRIYTFAMNGQTGKLVGDLPVDKAKAAKIFLLTAAVLEAVMAAVTFLL